MTIDEAIQHCEEVAEEQDKLFKQYDDASKYSRSYNKDIVSANAKKCLECFECAKQHRQLADWLKDLKAYKDARAEIVEAFNDDARGEQNDYERGRKSGIFLCESIISVKLGESRSEIPNTCGDAISRQAVLDLIEHYNSDGLGSVFYGYEQGVKFAGAVNKLPSVSPQQRTGRWIKTRLDGEPDKICDYCGTYCWKCSICGSDKSGWGTYKHCPDCGTKMEVEE